LIVVAITSPGRAGAPRRPVRACGARPRSGRRRAARGDRAALGPARVVALAFAIIGARVFPTMKYALSS
jgi:hypothetical protein